MSLQSTTRCQAVSTLAGRLAQLTMEEMRAETGDGNYQFIACPLALWRAS